MENRMIDTLSAAAEILRPVAQAVTQTTAPVTTPVVALLRMALVTVAGEEWARRRAAF